MKTTPDAHHDESKKLTPASAPPKAPPKPSTPPDHITVTDKGFEPSDFAAKVNEPVKWVNESGNAAVIEFDTDGVEGSVAPPSSPEMTEAAPAYEYTFTVPGGYKYHLAGDKKKTGTVNVK